MPNDEEAVKLIRRKLGVDAGPDVVIPFAVLCELLRIAEAAITLSRNLTATALNGGLDGDELLRRLNVAVDKIG